MLEAAGDDAGAQNDAAVEPFVDSVSGLEHGAVNRHGGVVADELQFRASVASGTGFQPDLGLRPLSEGFAPGY